MPDWQLTADLRRHFTWDLRAEVVETSTGPTNQYLDGFAMILAHRDAYLKYFNGHLADMGNPVPVMTGRSGAFLIGFLGRGVLVNLRGPSEGPEVLNPAITYLARERGIALVDDVCFSHKTLDALRSWVEARDLEVRGELVALPWMVPGEREASQLLEIGS